MKLIDALRIAKAPQEGPEFHVLIACGFTPLHLETAAKAHLRLKLPARTIEVRTGLYGDIAGTLENAGPVDGVTVALEWSDLDPRLGWRTMGPIDERIIDDVQGRLRRIASAIEKIAAIAPVSLSLPTLPMAPVFNTSTAELTNTQSRLFELLYSFASSTRATVVQLNTSEPSTRHDLRSELATGFPYTFAHADALALALVAGILPESPKKALITDLDETLWHGVLGDDGPDGISWDLDHHTQFHGLYQHLLNALAARGALIGVASKNNPEFVKEAFARRDLIVKPENLFPVEASWNLKVDAIRRMLKIWNLGEESVVFVDDNPFELEQIRRAFPAIDAVEFRCDDPAFLIELSDKFAKREVLEEDRLRVASLRSSQSLTEASEDPATLDELLAGAEASIVASWGKKSADHRAFELINKTNQFNLNGIRYTEADWNRFLGDPATHVMVVEYEDRFGKLGKIAVLVGSEDRDTFAVHTWVMSCRAFSRRIEHQILRLVLQRWTRVSMQFRATERNGPLQDFFAQIGVDSAEITRSEYELRCPPLFHKTEVVYQ